MSDLIPASLFPILKALNDKATIKVLSYMLEADSELYNEIAIKMYKLYRISPGKFKHIIRDLEQARFIEKQYESLKSYKWTTTQRGRDILSYLRDLVKFI